MSASSEPQLLVVCLCAAWCGTCREYEPSFESQGQAFAGRARFAWVDIEDHPDVLGPLDVEDFPTLLLARGDQVLFFGTVLPHAQTLARLVEAALADGLKPVADVSLVGLPSRVREVL